MNELTWSKALVMMALGDNKTFDPKSISGSEIGKVRVKAATEKLLAKAVHTEGQQANTLELQVQLGAVAWENVQKEVRPYKVRMAELEKKLESQTQHLSDAQDEIRSQRNILSKQEAEISALSQKRHADNQKHQGYIRQLKQDLRAARMASTSQGPTILQKQVARHAYARAATLPAEAISFITSSISSAPISPS